MQIKQVDKDGVVVCYLSGEIDINTSPQAKKIFDKLITSRKERIVLNFRDVNYVDSSGLATLVEMLKGLKNYGGKLKLSNLSAKVKGLFEITKLEKLFDIASEEEEAVKAFG